jgi:UDP-glucose 4-epimerase
LVSQAIRRAGRLAVQIPGPGVSAVASMFRRFGLVDFSPEQMEFLQFGRAVDTTRLHEDFGYRPAYTTVAAYDDFVNGRGLHRYVDPHALEQVEQRVLTAVDGSRRGRVREVTRA